MPAKKKLKTLPKKVVSAAKSSGVKGGSKIMSNAAEMKKSILSSIR